MSHVVNFYLEPAQKSDKDIIVALASRPVSEETEALLIGYVREALRVYNSLFLILNLTDD
jgi:hypothetical protein